MKSGLEDRNNTVVFHRSSLALCRLNEVRPGRPEQFDDLAYALKIIIKSQ